MTCETMAATYMFHDCGVTITGKAYADVRVDGKPTRIFFDPEPGELQYRVPKPTLVANKTDTVCDSPILLDDFTRVGVTVAIRLGYHPIYRPLKQCEFDRYCANQLEPGWNAEVYNAVVAHVAANK